MSEQLPGGIQRSPAEIKARWSSCWTPSEIAHHLTGIAAPWCVAAGWALDLFLGRQTRKHGDIEIAIPAARFPEVRDRFQRHHPPHPGRHPVPRARTGPAVQGEKRPPKGPGRLQRNRPTHDPSSARNACRATRSCTPGTSLARGLVTQLQRACWSDLGSAVVTRQRNPPLSGADSSGR
ncbi:nucleotidyltransferase domain-containing protein [Flindersiella endophytica]